MTRPVRGGLAIVIVALIVGGALLLVSFAPGGWRTLPIVWWFRSLPTRGLGAFLAVLTVLTVAVKAIRDARERDEDGVALPLRRRVWTGRRFVAAMVMPPLFILGGARLTGGFDGLLVGEAWTLVHLGLSILLGGCWLASAFHAFRSVRRCVLWILAGAGIVGSVVAATRLEESFHEVTRVRTRDASEYLLLRKWTMLWRFENRSIGAIARVQSSRLGVTWYETLVEAENISADYGMSPEFSLLIRPEDYGSDYWGQLFVSNDGFIASVWGDMYCDLAYDTKSASSFGEWHDGSGRRFGLGMESLSPFRLLDAGGTPSSADIGRLEEKAEEEAKHYATRPPAEWPEDRMYLTNALLEKPLLAALASPNELVREAARRIIRAGGKALYPEAFDKVK